MTYRYRLSTPTEHKLTDRLKKTNDKNTNALAIQSQIPQPHKNKKAQNNPNTNTNERRTEGNSQ